MTADQLSEINAALTALSGAGIVVAAWQLLVTKRQATTSFEDTIAREYRVLANVLPTEALLGEELSEEMRKSAFDELYHYFDVVTSR